jgi:hypothetical protein
MRNFLRKASEYYSTYSIELAFFKHRVLQVTRKFFVYADIKKFA